MPDDVSKTSVPDFPTASRAAEQTSRQSRGFRANMVKTSWWRRNFANNFSIEYELDAKIDQLRILLADLRSPVVPDMSDKMRQDLQDQLDAASTTLRGCNPLEPAMRRINFVEREIIRRLGNDHVDLALETLRAQVNISLPEPACKAMLAEIDKVAASASQATPNANAADQAANQKIKIVGLKTRLNEAVIELFRGSERTRNATQILGVSLMLLTFGLGVLLKSDVRLPDALFTHYGTNVHVTVREASTPLSVPVPPATSAQSPAGQGAGAAALPGSATQLSDLIQVVPNGEAPLIKLAFSVVLMAAALGGIGACLSGLFSFTLQERVPTEYEGYFRTLIRPVIGVASGFLAVFILRSGIFTFGDDLAWVAITALVFGFSERLFIGTMAKLESIPN